MSATKTQNLYTAMQKAATELDLRAARHVLDSLSTPSLVRHDLLSLLRIHGGQND